MTHIEPGNSSADAYSPLRIALRETIERTINRGIEQGAFPGGVLLVRHRDKVVFHEAYGHSFIYSDAHTISPHPIETRRNTVYDLASITKLFTATRVMQLVDEEKLRLDDPVAPFLPGFEVNGKANVTIRHLLTHTAGLPSVRLYEAAPTRNTRWHHVLAVAPDVLPGTACVYDDTNYILLGMLVEAVEGRGLDRSIETNILEPLRLTQTGYGPQGEVAGVAATEDQAYIDRGLVWGTVHDKNAWSLGGVAGHAGLFGTAMDVSVFGQAYLNGGAYRDVKILLPSTVAEMTQNQVGGLGSRGLGWQLNASYYMGGLASPNTYGHTGFTGTSIVIDPRRELVVVLLTNRVHPTRDGPDVNETREAVANAVLKAVDCV